MIMMKILMLIELCFRYFKSSKSGSHHFTVYRDIRPPILMIVGSPDAINEKSSDKCRSGVMVDGDLGLKR